MKIQPREIQSFLKAPAQKARAILVYGPEDGLMRERAKTLAEGVVDDVNDPFNAVTILAEKLIEDPARLSDEANALSMMGGARLIRITEASDKLSPILKEYLQNPSDQNLVIVEAGELRPTSSLRKLFEKEDNAAALPCYVEDERGVASFIRDMMRENGYAAEADAVGWLASHLVGNRQKARAELEKLFIYMGDHTQITLNDVEQCCGDASARSLDDLVYSTAGNNPDKALSSYYHLLEEGVPVIVVLRALQNHFRRLHLSASLVETGNSPDQAMKALSPPVFFKQQPAFKSHLQRWSFKALSTVLARLADLEARCKKTGAPVQTLCAQAILNISCR